MKTSSLQFKVLMIVAAAMVVRGERRRSCALNQVYGSIQDLDRISREDFQVQQQILHARGSFRQQVQEWKNVLLRGTRPRRAATGTGREFQKHEKETPGPGARGALGHAARGGARAPRRRSSPRTSRRASAIARASRPTGHRSTCATRRKAVEDADRSARQIAGRGRAQKARGPRRAGRAAGGQVRGARLSHRDRSASCSRCSLALVVPVALHAPRGAEPDRRRGALRRPHRAGRPHRRDPLRSARRGRAPAADARAR